MGEGLHIFRAAVGMFDPISLQDQYVTIHYMDKRHYRKVVYLEGLPPFQGIDLGALAVRTTSARINIPNLEMPDDEFGLFRWYPLDNAQIRLFLPRGVAKAELRNIQIGVDYKTMQRDPNLVSTEFAVWEDNRPAMEAVNGMDYALAAVRIIFMGYRFRTAKVAANIEQQLASGTLISAHVWCSGYGQSSR